MSTIRIFYSKPHHDGGLRTTPGFPRSVPFRPMRYALRRVSPRSILPIPPSRLACGSALPFLLTIVICVCVPLSSAAQRLPDSSVTPTLSEACRGEASRLPLFLLRWSAASQPHRSARRAAFGPIERAAYRLVEGHYTPYRDPNARSTWRGRFRYTVLQQTLAIDVVADSTVRRWERGEYALALDWNTPPVLRRVVLDDFRPRLASEDVTTLYAFPERRRALVEFLLPLGATASGVIQRRVDCLKRAFGLTDWARTDRDVQSPPHLRLTMNEARTRAIAAYGWGTRGGVWVLYTRSAPRGPWHEKRPIGAWSFER